MDNISAINLNDKQIRINTLLTELWDLPFCFPFKGFYVVLVQKLTSGRRVHLTWSGKKIESHYFCRISRFFRKFPDFLLWPSWVGRSAFMSPLNYKKLYFSNHVGVLMQIEFIGLYEKCLSLLSLFLFFLFLIFSFYLFIYLFYFTFSFSFPSLAKVAPWKYNLNVPMTIRLCQSTLYQIAYLK